MFARIFFVIMNLFDLFVFRSTLPVDLVYCNSSVSKVCKSDDYGEASQGFIEGSKFGSIR